MYTVYLSNYSFIGIISLLIFGAYLGYVRYHRYAHLRSLIEEYPDPDVILKDHDIALKVYGTIQNKEFVFSARIALFLNLIKPLAIPSISETLMKTRKSTTHPGYRVSKTTADIYEFLEPQARVQKAVDEGLVLDEKTISDQFKRRDNSFKRINMVHSKYRAKNDDYLYVLYISAVEIIHCIELCEWRKIDIRESNAIYKVWHEVGIRLHFKDIPATIQEWEDQMIEYGKKNSEYRSCNWEIARGAIDYLAIDLPKSFRNFAYYLFPCVLEDYECTSFGIPKPSPLKRGLFKTAMRLRGLYVRFLCLPRKVYKLHTFFDRDVGMDFSFVDPFKNQKNTEHNEKKPNVADFISICPRLQTMNKT
ncbi:hypothetical protein BY458DRAFT_552900 [Sporodiniella umbellata]|nr:hypothetical protein BY458DRAFT_552900 [Sporodiniella umbellata]